MQLMRAHGLAVATLLLAACTSATPTSTTDVWHACRDTMADEGDDTMPTGWTIVERSVDVAPSGDGFTVTGSVEDDDGAELAFGCEVDDDLSVSDWHLRIDGLTTGAP
ncbi:hypothetical protein KDN32_11105 [Nocardioides sp. J2M5]|uniref:hypothetical protein n=1 Tax=Nocardioides palaemonis TaxID=2829810 RepID=UPI001BADEA45|nr:hypothetical protein [Nocardioides palaemonis]MBS2938290.1 hypothetical protein [Nocardioides palaemonis]